MALLLGVDTGGTYTDAVLIRDEDVVIAAAKSLTTRADLAIGVGNAVRAVLAQASEEVRFALDRQRPAHSQAVAERRPQQRGRVADHGALPQRVDQRLVEMHLQALVAIVDHPIDGQDDLPFRLGDGACICRPNNQ